MNDESPAGGSDRLSSPAQLDELVQVSSPASWLLLVAFGGLVAASVGWGFLGRVDTRVQGEGVLLGGDIDLLVARGAGAVTRLVVAAGDEVAAGETVAEIEQPDLVRQIEDARTKVEAAQRDHDQLLAFSTREAELKSEYLARQRESLEVSIREAQERLVVLQEQMGNERALADKGVLTQRDLLPTQDTYNSTSASLERARAELTQLRSTELRDAYNAEKELLTSRRAIDDAEREVAKLEDDLARQARIVSTHAGVVLEVLAEVGSLVGDGQAVVKIGITADAARDLYALAYVDAADGKRIRPGMEVGLAPSTVQPERAGYLRGRVRRVSEFPATSEAMGLVLKNDPLVGRLAKGGEPFEIEVELIQDPESPSGLSWTSGSGPALEIDSGTLAKAYIVVERQRPIERVLPSVARLVGDG